VVPSQLMSKDVNGKSAQKFFPAQQPTASYTSLVEQHAAQLMDELFQDLTPDLEGSSQSSVRTSHSRHPERSDLALRIPLEDDSVLEGLIVPFVEMDATLESLFPPIPDEPISSQTSEGFVSKALLGIACLSLVGSVCLWIGTQFHRSTANPAIAQVPTVLSAANPDNAAFAEDLKHSLEEAPADNTVAQSSPLAAIPTAAAATAAPSGLFAANLPTAIASLPPLSSPAVKLPIRNAPKASQIFAMPNLASRKLASPPSVNFTATKTTPTTRLPTLTAAVLPTSLSNGLTNGLTVGNPAASSHVPPVGQSAGRSAKAGITIQGILDLGDKSAILIARNGSTQNVHTGEVLDSTGWVFLRIENGQAIIQRGSEIRSVSGGEQF
jgi:hypothetical protein